MTLRRKRCCCWIEQFKPHDMFNTGSITLIEGSVKRVDAFVILTVMPISILNCCKKITAVKLESELFWNTELAICTARTFLVPIPPPPHATMRTENASSTLDEVMRLFSTVIDSAVPTNMPPPLTNTSLARGTPMATQCDILVESTEILRARNTEMAPPKLYVFEDIVGQPVRTTESEMTLEEIKTSAL